MRSVLLPLLLSSSIALLTIAAPVPFPSQNVVSNSDSDSSIVQRQQSSASTSGGLLGLLGLIGGSSASGSSGSGSSSATSECSTSSSFLSLSHLVSVRSWVVVVGHLCLLEKHDREIIGCGGQFKIHDGFRESIPANFFTCLSLF
jgi:hypothetical protein